MTVNSITEIKVAHLHPDQVQRYEQLHNEIPAGIERHLRERGIVTLRIFREGLTLFMIFETAPSLELPDRVFDHWLEEVWHRQTGECFSVKWQDASEIYQLHK